MLAASGVGDPGLGGHRLALPTQPPAFLPVFAEGEGSRLPGGGEELRGLQPPSVLVSCGCVQLGAQASRAQSAIAHQALLYTHMYAAFRETAMGARTAGSVHFTGGETEAESKRLAWGGGCLTAAHCMAGA